MPFLAILAAFLLAASSAHAETVDLSPVVSLATQILQPLLLTVATWFVARIGQAVTKHLGLKFEDAQRQVVNDALNNALSFGVTKIASQVGSDALKVDLKSAVVAHAANYAITAIPATLQHFGITPDRLKDMLTARLENHPAVVAIAAPRAAPAK